jgi:predicted TIM-barrel fold metal-dependent hydrolase
VSTPVASGVEIPTALDPLLFLPEPEPRQVRYTVISVDDHLVEPAHMFEGRLPASLQDRAPKVVEDQDGHEAWEFAGERFHLIGQNAVAGRRPETVKIEPLRFADMRKGCWDIGARIHDMDIGGVWASMSFPSMITGFCGRVYSRCPDQELGRAVTLAWNDWLFEEWYSPYPQRIIPMGITYLANPEWGAEEIHRNAARGFRSVTLPERPHLIGFPSIFDEYWEPVIRACVETDTVISLHVGSSGSVVIPDGAPIPELGASLFGQLSMTACAEWLWAGWALRFPELKVAMSEGGVGWVPMLIDRLDNMIDRARYGLGWDIRPADLLRRNFWFCTLDDPSTMALRHVVGVDHIMLEVDYPHADSTWPDTQHVVERYWGSFPPAELRAICAENAARLYRHPLPDPVVPVDSQP